MTRVFIYDGREFDDPNPEMSVDDVRDYLSHFYRELANATCKHTSEENREVYEFRKTVGTKGAV